MRQIKFRAWITNANYTNQHGMGIIKRADFTGTKQPFDFVELEGFESSFRLDDVQIMQFTGLTDKNGKEIYEGDWVVMDCWNGGDGIEEPDEHTVFEGKIIWDANGWGIDTHPFEAKGEVALLGSNEFIKVEVIGNIYEQKELVQP